MHFLWGLNKWQVHCYLPDSAVLFNHVFPFFLKKEMISGLCTEPWSRGLSQIAIREKEKRKKWIHIVRRNFLRQFSARGTSNVPNSRSIATYITVEVKNKKKQNCYGLWPTKYDVCAHAASLQLHRWICYMVNPVLVCISTVYWLWNLLSIRTDLFLFVMWLCSRWRTLISYNWPYGRKMWIIATPKWNYVIQTMRSGGSYWKFSTARKPRGSGRLAFNQRQTIFNKLKSTWFNGM